MALCIHSKNIQITEQFVKYINDKLNKMFNKYSIKTLDTDVRFSMKHNLYSCNVIIHTMNNSNKIFNHTNPGKDIKTVFNRNLSRIKRQFVRGHSKICKSYTRYRKSVAHNN
ncbi:ribosome hibernation-promoting factor, HPF/YfiA family [Rickettsia endosymbiont of Cardiosporidium cionae]|uniref:ribosome hibernation-promoting factor, HPF/YfiA family n=1 Tax=Rickettsia endosymbiont of Cardiosporidium cionae TaxID=2777155 RepID=UPI001893CA53|nr:ribosome-associated translation inhibitor RaiA [Rickettsia endosymbiont of Cardiosporidium cionae]KAF8818129.1 hypothetical protein IHI24_000858 [Rickettsia endosymbiont of Cardiosporidium cionae]